jgi:hypothetical protein
MEHLDSRAVIYFTLDNVSLVEADRYRQMILTLFEQGFFTLRNGKVIVHFDHQGELQQIEREYVQYKRGKVSTLPTPQATVIISETKVDSPTQNNGRQ